MVPTGAATLSDTSVPGARVPTVFDTDAFRRAPRTVLWRRVEAPLLVLGPRQALGVVDLRRCDADAVRVVRRRSGGGAVLLGPGDPLWADLWIPSSDPLFDADVLAACVRVGEWWRAALDDVGVRDLVLHRGRAVEGPGADLCCFAGLGPGEVTAGGRKVLGLSQWRCKQGALFQCALYQHFEPAALCDLLALEGSRRTELVGALGERATGLGALAGPPARCGLGPGGLGGLAAAFEERLPEARSWARRSAAAGPA